MPELAALHAIGILAALILAMIHHGLTARAHRSPRRLRAQERLARIGMRWSDSQSRIMPFSSAELVREQNSDRRAAIVITTLAAFMGWLGVGFLLLVMVSAHLVARPRKERRWLESQLGDENEPSHEQIRQFALEVDPDMPTAK